MNQIVIGHYVTQDTMIAEPRIRCESPDLTPHIARPWFRAHLERHHGMVLSHPRRATSQAVVTDTSLARHALVCGASGGGKSRFLEHLLREQIRQGCSLVLIDPKGETVRDLMAQVHTMGVPADRVTLLIPRWTAGVPGWNPFAAGLSLTRAASDIVAVIEQSTNSWGPRMQDLLTNALIVLAAHGLSFYELVRLLVREDYCLELLRLPLQPSDPTAYGEARAYFVDEFWAWSKSERTSATGPAVNKVRELLRSSFLRPLLCARRQTLDLAGLWQRQGLVLVHLDRTTLGEEGARLLAGMLTQLIFRTSLRASGPVPVVLALDELATVERFVGSAISEIVTVARSQNLRLIACLQHMGQLTESLRAALLENTAVQLHFRLGAEGARHAAASLAAGTAPGVEQVTVRTEPIDRTSGELPRAVWRHPIRDASGRPMRLSPAAWQRLLTHPNFGSNPIQALRSLVKDLRATRLYVHSADRGEPVEIGRYVQGLGPTECRIEGPAPLELAISFPRPRIARIERVTEASVVRSWTKILQELPIQHCVVRVAGRDAGVVKVVDVQIPPSSPGQRAFIQDAMRAHGQSEHEIATTLRWREEEVERVASGGARSQEGEHDDGSLA